MVPFDAISVFSHNHKRIIIDVCGVVRLNWETDSNDEWQKNTRYLIYLVQITITQPMAKWNKLFQLRDLQLKMWSLIWKHIATWAEQLCKKKTNMLTKKNVMMSFYCCCSSIMSNFVRKYSSEMLTYSHTSFTLTPWMCLRRQLFSLMKYNGSLNIWSIISERWFHL